MRLNNLRTLFALVLVLSSSATVAQQPNYEFPTDPHARNLVILTSWFEGEFDNEEQLWYQSDRRSQTPSDVRHVRLHTFHRRLELPDFGDHVFYVEEYKNNDPEDLVRQRFVLFTSDGLEGGIRMRQGFFRNAENALGSQFNPEQLSDLSPDDVFFLDECDVFWKRVADQYEGEMRPKACVFGEGAERRYSVHNMVLSQDKYWRVDATRLVSDDSLHVGHAEDNPTRMRRADSFICEVNFRFAAGASQKVEGLRLHSQGGIQRVVREDNGEAYILRLRDKQYPFYNTRPDFLFLAIRKDGEQRSLGYTVSDPDARRLGVSVGDTLAHCFREGYTFLQPIELL